MADEAPRDIVFATLLRLVEHEFAVSQDYTGQDEVTHSELQMLPDRRRIHEQELEVILSKRCPTDGETCDLRSWIYLPVLPRGIGRIPLLNAIYDYRSGSTRLSLQVGIFWLNDDFDWRGDAWRFESPEGADESHLSDHDYFHAQPCHTLRTERFGDLEIEYPPASMAADVPTFPVDASNDLGLLVATIVTLYGRRDGARLLRLMEIPALDEAMAQMRCMQPRHVAGG